MTISFAWYDLWVGAYWDRKSRVLYICPLPCLLITIPTHSTETNPDGSEKDPPGGGITGKGSQVAE